MSDAGNGPPPKPWERSGTSSGPAPFKPASPGSTSNVVEASGTSKPGELVSTTLTGAPVNANAIGRPLPTRPWERQPQNTYGGYNSIQNYNSGYGSGIYGSSYGGGFGGSYGSGMYGNNMYRGGGYNNIYGAGSSMYGGGMVNGGFGAPYGEQDPNNPYGAPSSPPGFWISFLRVMQGVVNFFGRFAMLVDQNTQAFHLFMSALLQLFDRSGMLYGEIARFAFRILGMKMKSKRIDAPENTQSNSIEGPKAGNAWDNVWGESSG